jgi:hypothetical protein
MMRRDRYTRRDIDRAARRAARGAVCRECLAETCRQCLAGARPADAAPPKGRPRLIGWDLVFLRPGPRAELAVYARCPAGHVATAYVPL